MPPPSSSNAAAAPPPLKRPKAAISSAPSLSHLSKRTRELPNLSVCQACTLRITNNGKDRLHILDSFWRIVILCSKCLGRVNSADLCSYCLSQLGECPGFGCRDCNRRVHKDCVSEYKGSAPWSYCPCLESVCLDCWLPGSMPYPCSRSKSVGQGKIRAKTGNGEVLGLSSSKISDKVSRTESLEDVVKDVNFEVERKFVVAARAKEKALRKVVVAKSAVEMAAGALDLVLRKNEDTAKAGSEATLVDDAELAFRLHRAMNSSPRISQHFCSVNSVSSSVPKAVNCDIDSLACSGRKGDVCENIDPDRIDSKASVQPRISVNFNEFLEENKKCQENYITRTPIQIGMNGVVDAKTDAEDSKLDLSLKEGEGSCSNRLVISGADHGSMDWESQSCKQDLLGLGLHTVDSGTECRLKSGGDTEMQGKGFIEKPDRYLIKYSKRGTSSRTFLNSVTKVHCEGYIEGQASLPGLLLGCSKASGTLSDASFGACTLPVQTYASARGSS